MQFCSCITHWQGFFFRSHRHILCCNKSFYVVENRYQLFHDLEYEHLIQCETREKARNHCKFSWHTEVQRHLKILWSSSPTRMPSQVEKSVGRTTHQHPTLNHKIHYKGERRCDLLDWHSIFQDYGIHKERRRRHRNLLTKKMWGKKRKTDKKQSHTSLVGIILLISHTR